MCHNIFAFIHVVDRADARIATFDCIAMHSVLAQVTMS